MANSHRAIYDNLLKFKPILKAHAPSTLGQGRLVALVWVKTAARAKYLYAYDFHTDVGNMNYVCCLLEKQQTLQGQKEDIRLFAGMPKRSWPFLAGGRRILCLKHKSSGQLQPRKAVAWSRNREVNWEVALLQYAELFNICSCQQARWKKCISNASAHCLSTSLFGCAAVTPGTAQGPFLESQQCW